MTSIAPGHVAQPGTVGATGSIAAVLRGCGYALMLAMVFTPVTHNAVKLVLAAVVLTGAVLGIAGRGELRLHRDVLLWFVFYVAVGGVFVLRGYVDGAPGAMYVAAVYVGFPALYGVLVDAASSLRVIRGLVAAAIIGCMATSAYMLLYALWAAGVVPSSMFFMLDETQGIGFHDGFVQMRLYSISGLVFLVPFIAAALVSYSDAQALPLRRRWLWAALILGLCGTFLSGRKALMLTVAMTPVLIGVLSSFLPPAARARSRVLYWRFVGAVGLVVVAALIYLPATGAFDLDRFLAMVASAFDFQGDVGANERMKQLRLLLGEWTEKPAFGWGWGQGARGLVRSGRVWEYELQYALLLFSTGLVGALLYASGVAWIYLTGLRVLRSGRPEGQHMLPMLIGLTSILMAHGSNPYLVSAGNMWMVFLPVATINCWLLHQRDAINPATTPATVNESTLQASSSPAPRAPADGGLTVHRALGAIVESWKVVLACSLLAAGVTLAVVLRRGHTYTATMELTTVTAGQVPRLGGAVGAMLDFGSGGIEATPALVLRLMRTDAVLTQVAMSPYPDAAHPLIRSIVAPDEDPIPREEYGKEVERLLRTSVDRDAGVIGIEVTHRDSAVARAVALRVQDATTEAFSRASRAQASQLRQAQESRVEDARDKLRTAERRLVEFTSANRAVPQHSPLYIQQRQLEREVEVAQAVYMQAVNEHQSAVGKELEETPALVVLDPIPATFAPDKRLLGLKVVLAAILGALLGAGIGLARRMPSAAAEDDRLYLRQALHQLPLVGRAIRNA